jgi:hypothetical protein
MGTIAADEKLCIALLLSGFGILGGLLPSRKSPQMQWPSPAHLENNKPLGLLGGKTVLALNQTGHDSGEDESAIVWTDGPEFHEIVSKLRKDNQSLERQVSH